MKLYTPSATQLLTTLVLAGSYPSVFAQSAVNNYGFSDSDNATHIQRQTWLQRNWQLLLIIIATLFVVILLTWYIVRSVKDMRRRLALANEQETCNLKGYERLPFQRSPTLDKYQQPDSPPPEYSHRY
ncbi:hypothetical protein BX666DRAFT_1878022 [Dichotomocladium elegans]|nr:hypothetical protein BX666DRAFT_1878022 [Dichotomocladium elegans]